MPEPLSMSTEQVEEAARVVVHALTALAVRDKLTADRSLISALALLEEHFPDQLGDADRDPVLQSATRMGQGVNFRGLDPGLLGEIYERAVLIPARRLRLGAYYTPPELAREIVNALPVEHIPPDSRTFIDPSCGSGTLLLAASDRLSASMPDDRVSERGRFEYARARLFGSDNDPFAVDIARLALFLHALPYGNGFRIEREDALESASADGGLASTSLAVTNPPWRFERGDGKTAQAADRFLRSLVERMVPEGFFACVLPVSWLTDDVSRPSRSWVRDRVDVFEVWRLPRRFFQGTTMAPGVIFGQVTERLRPRQFVFRNVWSKDRRTFLRDGVASQAFLTEDRVNEMGAPFTADPFAYVSSLRAARPLARYAEIRDGAPTADVNAVGSQGGPYGFLRFSSDIAAFGSVDPESLGVCRYPEDFSGRGATASPSFYLRPRISVTAMGSVDVPWRMRAALDETEAIPRNSVYAVVPRDNTRTSRLALLGVLSSAFAAAWIVSRTATRMINATVLKDLPVPAPRYWPAIADATAEVHAAVTASDADLAPLVLRLEALVCAAYGLTPADIGIVAEIVGGHPGPEGVLRYPHPRDEEAGQAEDLRSEAIGGSVLAVSGGRLRVHIPGMTDPSGEWMKPPARLPGWLARPGSTFEVSGPVQALSACDFRFQRFAWMSLDELLAEFEA